jgi:heptosyltransferase-1
MMRVLLVKTSSLGDVIHTLPALTDAAAALPGLVCDWLVEEAYAEIPGWHPAVRDVIPLGLRRWRGHWRRAVKQGEPQALLARLRRERYDRVIDAQGLIKSGLLTAWTRGPGAGYDWRGAREPVASVLYRRRHAVSRALHAVERSRLLFASELGYASPASAPDYGIRRLGRPSDPKHPHLVFLHATTWPSKHWPALYWAELADLATRAGYRVRLPWYSPEDRLAAEHILAAAGCGELLPREDLTGMAGWLGSAAGVVGVDTGLAHLAAALGTPAVTLYGPSRVELTGALGRRQRNLAVDFPCAPCRRRRCDYTGEAEVHPACFSTLPPELVWDALLEQMDNGRAEC